MIRPIVWRLLGQLLLGLSACMLLPLAWSVAYHETGAVRGFLAAMVVGTLLGAGGWYRGRGVKGRLYRKEGIAVVAFAWLACGVVGALPFLFSGAIANPVDALFEAVSGFTTTGATILTDIESLPVGLLFWRSFTHWFGGIGIVVLFVAVLPGIGVGGRYLMHLELPGPSKEGLSPKIKDTAVILITIYLGMTVAEVLLLKLAGLSWFDALTHTFGTLATGGFSPYSASIGHFQSLTVELIVIGFMILAGINFSLFYTAMARRSLWPIKRNVELRAYLIILGSATLWISANLLLTGTVDQIGQAIRAAGFQVVAIATGTGYGTADFDAWPPLSRILLLLLMFVGGCAGSTSGSIKVIRWVTLVKIGALQVFHFFRPREVVALKVGRQEFNVELQAVILGFFILFICIFLGGGVVLAAMGYDIVTAATAVAATLGNIGPGLGRVGPIENYAFFNPAAKLLLTACMLLGRLELYTMLAVMTPAFWRR